MVEPAILYALMVILVVFCVAGTIGNGLVILVYSTTKNMDKMTSTTFILTLGVLDFITCIFIIPMTIYFEFTDFEVNSNALCKLYTFCTPYVVAFSVFVMVAIAIDRYLCICHPFLHAMNPFRAKLMILVAAALAVSTSVVWPVAYSVYAVRSSTSGNTSTNDTAMNANASSGFYSHEINATDITHVTITGIQSRGATPGATNGLPGEVYYTGSCAADEITISTSFRNAYRKFHYIFYLLDGIVVTVLYVLIYVYVVTRRRKRSQQRCLASKTAMTCCEESTKFTVQDNGGSGGSQSEQEKVDDENNVANYKLRASEAKDHQKTYNDKVLMANIKTAATLFVVTLVFIITYVPTSLFGESIIPYNTIGFYMYFLNNVANPFIYGFMNQNFRNDLKNMLCKRRRHATF